VRAMTLTEPYWLLALLVLPLLWWLSQPPKPSRDEWTAHLQQWQAALHALRRRPPRGSLWRFVLLALATIAVTLAAARPVVVAAPGVDRLVVLLDGSASMHAIDGDGVSAFDAARARVRAALAEVPEHVEVTVLRCGGELLRRHGRSARALHELGDAGGALAVDLVALADAAADERTAVWTVTDGQGQEALPTTGALTVLSRAGANAAIAAVRVDDAWPLPSLALEVDVVAFAARPAKVVLRATGAVAARELELPPLSAGVVTTVPLVLDRRPEGGVLQLRVELAGDRLPRDDAYSVALPPLPAPRIAALREDDGVPFAAVAADTLAAEVGGEVVPASDGGAVGLLLVDGGLAPLRPGEVRALTFGSRLSADVEPEPWVDVGAVDWAREHELTRGLDLSELRVASAWRGLLPDGVPFLWADAGTGRVPLAVVAGDEVRSVHFAFRLQDANLPLLAAFPQLLRRAFVHSYGRAARLSATSAPPPAGEQDLRDPATAPDRALPDWAGRDRPLARWCVVAGLLALALRAFVR